MVLCQLISPDSDIIAQLVGIDAKRFGVFTQRIQDRLRLFGVPHRGDNSGARSKFSGQHGLTEQSVDERRLTTGKTAHDNYAEDVGENKLPHAGNIVLSPLAQLEIFRQSRHFVDDISKLLLNTAILFERGRAVPHTARSIPGSIPVYGRYPHQRVLDGCPFLIVAMFRRPSRFRAHHDTSVPKSGVPQPKHNNAFSVLWVPQEGQTVSPETSAESGENCEPLRGRGTWGEIEKPSWFPFTPYRAMIRSYGSPAHTSSSFIRMASHG